MQPAQSYDLATRSQVRPPPPLPIDTDSSPSSWGQAAPATPAGGFSVTVSVLGVDFNYNLMDDDVRKVFGRYGRVTAVEIVRPELRSARVWYASYSDAEVAIKDLDGKVLPGVHGRLSVEWTGGRSPKEALSSSFLDKTTATSPDDHHMNSSPEFGTAHPDQAQVRKFTCRFEIGIENDKEFQVARRIIGQKGSNMKRIVKNTDAKLRLRGRGSGYLEGAAKVESPEPLHLCISCVSPGGYKQAVGLVTELLASVYEEYRRYCRARGTEPHPALGVNIKEYPLIVYGGDFFDGDDTPPHDDN